MKIAIYHPNINNFGGGETVALTIASALAEKNQVDILTPNIINKNKLEKFFDLNLKKVNMVKINEPIKKLPTLNSIKSSVLLRSTYKKLEEYDTIIDTATNGWFDKKLDTKTICYVHFPFFYSKKKGIKKIIQPFIIQQENAFKYDKILCNSNFTKKYVENISNKNAEVLYPPVKVKCMKPKKKKKRIVTIGRFTYDKKHEVMINAFKELYKNNKNYTLHIIGAFRKDVELYKKNYLEMLKDKAKGYPIKFHVNMPHKKVLRFLEETEIYWHARGYGETDLNEYENFGITTVEAMAAGCVPIVINLGAQPEIVEHEKSGYCWNNPQELIRYTLTIIKNPNLTKKLIKKAIKKAKQYDISIFKNKIKKIMLK